MGGGTWGGMRRRWGLSIVRSSRSFRCAAIRARRGVFGGVSLSLENYQLKNKVKERKKHIHRSKFNMLQSRRMKFNVIKVPNQSQIQ